MAWTLHRLRQHRRYTKRSSRTENPHLVSQTRTSNHKDCLYLHDGKEAYAGNPKLFRTPSASEVSKIEMRMPSWVELHAYVFGGCSYPKHSWLLDHGSPIIPRFVRWPAPQHPMLAGWMEKMRPAQRRSDIESNAIVDSYAIE